MSLHKVRVLLADDDMDDCLVFEEALAEVAIPASFSFVHDGERLMKLLATGREMPDVLFLDLNMPRKNGFDCLDEIKKNSVTKNIPVVVISTSFNPEVIQLLFERGARHYIRKPDDFKSLRSVIEKGIRASWSPDHVNRENFVIQP